MQDDIVAAIDGPVNYAHLMSSEAFGAPNQRACQFPSSLLLAIQIGSYGHSHFRLG